MKKEHANLIHARRESLGWNKRKAMFECKNTVNSFKILETDPEYNCTYDTFMTILEGLGIDMKLTPKETGRLNFTDGTHKLESHLDIGNHRWQVSLAILAGKIDEVPQSVLEHYGYRSI